jgi:hypothetical protein
VLIVVDHEVRKQPVEIAASSIHCGRGALNAAATTVRPECRPQCASAAPAGFRRGGRAFERIDTADAGAKHFGGCVVRQDMAHIDIGFCGIADPLGRVARDYSDSTMYIASGQPLLDSGIHDSLLLQDQRDYPNAPLPHPHNIGASSMQQTDNASRLEIQIALGGRASLVCCRCGHFF